MPKSIPNQNLGKETTKDVTALQRVEKPIEECTIHLVAGGIPIVLENGPCVLIFKRVPTKSLYPEYGNFNTFHIGDQIKEDGKGGFKVVFESAIGAQMRERSEEFLNLATGRIAPVITKAFDFVDPEIQVRFVFAGIFVLEFGEAQANAVLQIANGEVQDQKLPEHNAGWKVPLAELPAWISCMTPAEQFVLAKIRHDRPEPNVVSSSLYSELVKPIRDALRKEKKN